MSSRALNKSIKKKKLQSLSGVALDSNILKQDRPNTGAQSDLVGLHISDVPVRLTPHLKINSKTQAVHLIQSIECSEPASMTINPILTPKRNSHSAGMSSLMEPKYSAIYIPHSLCSALMEN